MKSPENVFPVLLLEKTLDEELILIKSDISLCCYSNICTHRGFKLIHHPAKIVKPIDTEYYKVEFMYYIRDWDLWEKFGKDDLAEKVEREDEFVVEAVQKGLKSQFYSKGRFSPKREKGVHYFHRLIAQYINS